MQYLERQKIREEQQKLKDEQKRSKDLEVKRTERRGAKIKR